jgi:hypothetical protein
LNLVTLRWIKSQNKRISENLTQFSFSPREKAGMRGKAIIECPAL